MGISDRKEILATQSVHRTIAVKAGSNCIGIEGLAPFTDEVPDGEGATFVLLDCETAARLGKALSDMAHQVSDDDIPAKAEYEGPPYFA